MKIENLEQLNEEMAHLAEAERHVEKHTLEHKNKVAELDAKLKKAIGQEEKNIKTSKKAIVKFAEDNKDELFKDSKTYTCPSGKVSLRSNKDKIVFVEDEATTIGIIKKSFKDFIDKFIKKSEKVDKTAVYNANEMGFLSDDQLKKMKVNRESSESINIKTN